MPDISFRYFSAQADKKSKKSRDEADSEASDVSDDEFDDYLGQFITASRPGIGGITQSAISYGLQTQRMGEMGVAATPFE